MKDRLIYITEGITYQDVKNDKITKIEVYEKQINNWFIKPAQLLADSSKKDHNYEMEISLLTLMITFFESHGQYLLGESSMNNSRRVFVSGFRSFLEYLIYNKRHKEEYYLKIDLDQLYRLVRCGLLHNGYIKANGVCFFIDKLKLDKDHVVYPNTILGGSLLINTHNMIEEIKVYLDYYIDLVHTNDKVRRKFEHMFNEFFEI